MSYIRPMGDDQVELDPNITDIQSIAALEAQEKAEREAAASSFGKSLSEAFGRALSFLSAGTSTPPVIQGKTALPGTAAAGAGGKAPAPKKSALLPMLLVGGVLIGAVALLARKAHQK